jgi:signal transduction histidine kinase
VIVAAIGGLWPALVTAIIAFFADEIFFTMPYDSLSIRPTSERVALFAFVVVGLILGTMVGILIDQLSGLANEQAALRRVATLVAESVSPEQVFAAVTVEVGQLLNVDMAILYRSGHDGALEVAWGWERTGRHIPVGASHSVGPNRIPTDIAADRSAPRDGFADNSGSIHGNVSETAAHSVDAPIFFEGRTWGVLSVTSIKKQSLPSGTHARLAAFADLVAIAIANAEGRIEVAASRARVVAAADEARRRIERDLHDGAQQRLIALQIELRTAQAMVPPDALALRDKLSSAENDLNVVAIELQEISRGVHPAALSRAGLALALRVLARRSAVPVELDVRVDQPLPDSVEIAAYYVVSEALSNAAEHAHASVVRVKVEEVDSSVDLLIVDDGIGGADPSRGSGLIGLKDRVESFGGKLDIVSGSGVGTSLHVVFPIDPTPGHWRAV